jgi:hypothetical protein
MAHLTLSVPKELYEEMRKHPEIKWSEVARKAIGEYLSKLGSKSTSSEVLRMLPQESRMKLVNISTETAKRFYSEMVKNEWKRMKYLTRTS